MARTDFTGGQYWRDASTSNRCPVCIAGGKHKGDSWCQIGIGPNAGTVLCKREHSPVEKENGRGDIMYVHRLDGADIERFRAMECDPPSANRVSAALCDRAYGVLLGQLRLSNAHRRALHARRLTDEHIARAGYVSLDVPGRAALARAVVDALGESDALGVPGIARAEKDGRQWLTIKGAAGLVIPTRDVLGRVAALTIRGDGDGSKYTMMTSSKARPPGAKASCIAHVPVLEGGRDQIIITEGVLKSDVATALSGRLVVGLPGVGAWREAVPVLEALRPSRVYVAFDMDRLENKHVQAALERAFAGLKKKFPRITFGVMSWDPAHKGIDDFLAAKLAAREAA